MYRFRGEEPRMYRFGGEESKIMASEKSVMAVIRAARPKFENPPDKVAFAVHATFVAAGYVLHATAPRAFRDDVFSFSTVDEVGIDGWNTIPESYAFLYSNPEERSVKVLVKALVLDFSLIVDVLKELASEPLHLELKILDYIEDWGTNYASHYRDFGKLVEEVNKKILCKLNDPAATKLNNARAATKLKDAPAVTKSSNRPSNSRTRVREEDLRPRIKIGEVPPYPGSGMGFDYPDGRIDVPPYSGDYDLPIPGSGTSDLFPGPGAGMYPSRVRFGSGGPGGMLIGPNDPLFIGGRTRQSGRPGRPSGVPPGARFDPFGPPDVPGFEPDRFGRGPPPRGGGMHPDFHHFHNGSDFI